MTTNFMVRNKKGVFGNLIALEFGFPETIKEIRIFLENGFRIVNISEINRDHLKHGRSVIGNRIINSL